MYFTREDILKILKALLLLGIKDSEFKTAQLPLLEDDTITIVQNNVNRKVKISNIIGQFNILNRQDFINVSDMYDEHYITINEAIKLMPLRKRKEGLVITFQNTSGKWQIYQFKGTIDLFVNPTYWEDLFSLEYPIINSIIPDEEDLTMSKPDEDGNSLLSFKDKDYDPEGFSGMATKILRKNIKEINGIKRNILTQEDFNKENCIYEIRYNFDLNELIITIPNNCVLKFEGGLLSNGTIIGQNTSINALLLKIFNEDITIDGTWNVNTAYPEWCGATGDGITDETNIFKQVFNISRNIVISSGTYIINKLFVIGDKGITLQGIGNPIITHNLIAPANVNPYYTSALYIYPEDYNNTFVEYLHIDGIIFDGNRENILESEPTNIGDMRGEIIAKAVSNVQITNCIFRNTAFDAFSVNGCSNAVFISNTFENIGGNLQYVSSYNAINVGGYVVWRKLFVDNITLIENNIFRNIRDEAISLVCCRNVTINNNLFYNMGDRPVEESWKLPVEDFCYKITNNIIDGFNMGLGFSDWTDKSINIQGTIEINGNIFKNNGYIPIYSEFTSRTFGVILNYYLYSKTTINNNSILVNKEVYLGSSESSVILSNGTMNIHNNKITLTESANIDRVLQLHGLSWVSNNVFDCYCKYGFWMGYSNEINIYNNIGTINTNTLIFINLSSSYNPKISIINNNISFGDSFSNTNENLLFKLLDSLPGATIIVRENLVFGKITDLTNKEVLCIICNDNIVNNQFGAIHNTSNVRLLVNVNNINLYLS